MKAGYVVQTGSRRHVVQVREVDDGYEITIDGKVHQVDSCRLNGTPSRSLIVAGRSYETSTVEDGDRYDVYLSGEIYPVMVYDEVWARASEGHATASSGEEIQAPIPGSVVRVLVAEGDHVTPGTAVAVLEAMKMQNEIVARTGGVVTRIAVAVGDSVATGQMMMVLRPAEPAGEVEHDAASPSGRRKPGGSR